MYDLPITHVKLSSQTELIENPTQPNTERTNGSIGTKKYFTKGDGYLAREKMLPSCSVAL